MWEGGSRRAGVRTKSCGPSSSGRCRGGLTATTSGWEGASKKIMIGNAHYLLNAEGERIEGVVR